MGFRTNANQQMSLNDRFNNMTERELHLFAKTWAKPFADKIFPLIDEANFKVLYCTDNGRPNTPVNVVVGALLLKELTQLTDEELMESILFDTRYQYALHLTSFNEIPFSDRTLSRFRERLYWHESETGEDLLKKEIERLANEFKKIMGIHNNLKRMDSVMISSSCKNMGRLELIYTCVSNLVNAIIKSGGAETLPGDLLKYADDKNKNAYCYRLSKDEVMTRLETVTADAILAYEFSGALNGCADEYQLLERLLKDQTENSKLKPNKQIKPDSLQNPSDEDATFRRKSGKEYQGYVAGFVEDCGENGNIITQYSYDVNHHPDTLFGAEIIEGIGGQEEEAVLIGDGAFASEANFEAAEANNIKLVTTNMAGQKPPKIVMEFNIRNDLIKTCPAGETPVGSIYNDKKDEYRAHFNRAACEICPRREECPAVMQKKAATVKLSKSTLQRAEYTQKLSTEEYKEYSRKRNGVEGVLSIRLFVNQTIN